MGKITSVGSFRGDVTDSGVSLTSSGLPQFVMQLTATEWYNTATNGWVDFAGADENDITAYLVLFGKNGKALFNCKDVMEITGWDGKSFATLNAVDLSEGIQFRVEENEYNDKISMQVSNISKWDSVPGGAGIRKIDAAKLSEIDAKYGGALAKVAAELGKKVTAAKPKTTKKTVKAPKETAKKSSPPKSTKGEATPKSANEAITKAMTQQAAWEALVKVQPAEIPDDKLGEIWLAKIETVGGGTDSDDFTEEQWGDVFKAVEMQLIEDTCPY